MKKPIRTVLILVTVIFVLCVTFLVLLMSGPEAKAKDNYMQNFDLRLRGKVLNITQNEFGQYLVCLQVLTSNYEDYFPIHNPNKYRSERSDLWEERFFIKVKDSLAAVILTNKKTTRVLHNKIGLGDFFEINLDGRKDYKIYQAESNNYLGGKKILTAPLRNNIEKSCLKN